MAFVAGTQPGYDAAKCVKMALMHDIAEAIVGDLTPHDGVPKAEKHAREAAAIARMQLMLGQRAWAAAGARAVARAGTHARALALTHRRCRSAFASAQAKRWLLCGKSAHRPI
jgi:hypothetical protein